MSVHRSYLLIDISIIVNNLPLGSGWSNPAENRIVNLSVLSLGNIFPGRFLRAFFRGLDSGTEVWAFGSISHFGSRPLLFFIRRRCCWLCVRLHLSLILYGGQFGNNLFGIF